MAWVILAKEIWTKQIKKPTSDNLEKLMNIELLEKATNNIVQMVQLKSLGEEIRILNANSDSRIGVNKSSKLYKLDTFLDSDGFYELVADWGNPDSLIVKLILWFFQNKATYQKQSYDGAMEMLPVVEEE